MRQIYWHSNHPSTFAQSFNGEAKLATRSCGHQLQVIVLAYCRGCRFLANKN